jgi:hypothetical protein
MNQYGGGGLGRDCPLHGRAVKVGGLQGKKFVKGEQIKKVKDVKQKTKTIRKMDAKGRLQMSYIYEYRGRQKLSLGGGGECLVFKDPEICPTTIQPQRNHRPGQILKEDSSTPPLQQI